jgi:DNA topoisomerase-1
MGKRQRATAMYFIDVLALRAGNEKGADEADTVGCCSLRLEHLQLTPPTQLRFDFLGKDSIRYLNVVDVDPQVFKNIKIFKKDKEEEDQIFDRLEVRRRRVVCALICRTLRLTHSTILFYLGQTTGLNKHLSSLMPGLSAKVFRTYNASWTMQQRLDAVTDDNASISDKLLAYNRANREVAVLCNHQKAVAKGHGASMQKLTEKVPSPLTPPSGRRSPH